MKPVAIIGNLHGHFHPLMGEDERHEARIAFDFADTDEKKLAWVAKWGRRVADHLWSRN